MGQVCDCSFILLTHLFILVSTIFMLTEGTRFHQEFGGGMITGQCWPTMTQEEAVAKATSGVAMSNVDYWVFSLEIC